MLLNKNNIKSRQQEILEYMNKVLPNGIVYVEIELTNGNKISGFFCKVFEDGSFILNEEDKYKYIPSGSVTALTFS